MGAFMFSKTRFCIMNIKNSMKNYLWHSKVKIKQASMKLQNLAFVSSLISYSKSVITSYRYQSLIFKNHFSFDH